MNLIKPNAPEHEIREAEQINKVHLAKVHQNLSLMGAGCIFSLGITKHSLPVVCLSEALPKEKIIEILKKVLYDMEK